MPVEKTNGVFVAENGVELPFTAVHENIQGLGSNTEHTNYILSFPGKDVVSTFSYSQDPSSGNSISVISYWDSGTVIHSDIIIQDRSEGSFDVYSSDFGAPITPLIITGGGNPHGGMGGGSLDFDSAFVDG